MVLNPILLGGVWFIIHRYSVFHTFIWRGWVGGLSQMKLTSFEKNCHILRRSLTTVQISKNSSTLKTAWPNEQTLGGSIYGRSVMKISLFDLCNVHSYNKCNDLEHLLFVEQCMHLVYQEIHLKPFLYK
jgi:hypothetical protein